MGAVVTYEETLNLHPSIHNQVTLVPREEEPEPRTVVAQVSPIFVIACRVVRDGFLHGGCFNV